MARARLNVERGDYPKVTELAAKGKSLPTIARALGMSPGALRKHMAATPALADAYALGKAQEEEALVAQLRATKSPVALKFLLQSRHGYRDTEAAGPAVQVTHNTLQLAFPKPVKPEDLPKLAQAMGAAQPLEARALPAPAKPANKGRDPLVIDGHVLFAGDPDPEAKPK